MVKNIRTVDNIYVNTQTDLTFSDKVVLAFVGTFSTSKATYSQPGVDGCPQTTPSEFAPLVHSCYEYWRELLCELW